jgi:hypothetical protein
MRKLIAAINSSFKEQIERLGFRRKKDRFILEINDETIGWVCLDRVPYRGQGAFDLDPMIAIINRTIEQLICKFEGREYNESQTATAIKNIGYMMPERSFKTYLFYETLSHEEIKALVKDMVDTIAKYAVPWMRRLSDREELMRGLEKERISLNLARRYTLPVLYLLLGRKEQAIEYGKSQLTEIKDPKPFNAAEVFGGIEGVTVITPPSGPFMPSQAEIKRYEAFLDRIIKYEVVRQ